MNLPSLAVNLPNELWIQVFNRLSFRDLFSVCRVNRQWRSLAPAIDESPHLVLLRIALGDIHQPPKSLYPLSLADRLSYVSKIESTANITIPEPYRTVLTEWPAKQPPTGFHWPHAVRFHATGFCSCRNSGDDDAQCTCEVFACYKRGLMLRDSLLTLIRNNKPFDFHHPSDDSRWELFSNTPRLHTDAQNEQTLRFIRAHQPGNMWSMSSPGGSWQTLSLATLRLSHYACNDDSGVMGEFVMILDGPLRGEIHGWDMSGWYNGFEASSFLDWRYDE